MADAIGALYSIEITAIAGAVRARQRECLAGRCHARLAMQKLVEPAAAISSAESCEPIWPKSLVRCSKSWHCILSGHRS